MARCMGRLHRIRPLPRGGPKWLQLSSDRFVRQQDLVPAERLAELLVTVIGVGSIGRQVARTLAAIGARRMQLVDFDRVENGTARRKGIWWTMSGNRKLWPWPGRLLGSIRRSTWKSVEDRYRPKLVVGRGRVLLRRLDRDPRRDLANRRPAPNSGPMVGCWPRPSAILVAADEASRRHYPTTLFPASEAHPGSCTARNTFDTAEIAAGLMVHQFIRWLRGQRVDADISLNLLASELVVSGGAD